MCPVPNFNLDWCLCSHHYLTELIDLTGKYSKGIYGGNMAVNLDSAVVGRAQGLIQNLMRK